jgi:hypothetical protein
MRRKDFYNRRKMKRTQLYQKAVETYGISAQEDILLLLSIDDLTDEELNIKPQAKVGK